MASPIDTGLATITKSRLKRQFGSVGAITGDDIAYDASQSLNERILTSSGDMTKSVYDVSLRSTDIFDYADASANAKISDTVYGAGWNGDTTHGPSKNAIYDKIESLVMGTGDVVGPASAVDSRFASFDGVSGKLLKDSLRSPSDITRLESYTSTGLRNGCTITINADPTKFDIASGIMYFVDNTTVPNTPTFTKLDYAGSNANVVTNLATSNVTYVSINSSGVVVQRTSPLTPAQRRDEVALDVIVHSNRTSINAINNLPEVLINGTNQLYDLMDALRNFNESGNVFSANGANLQINKSSGSLFKAGVNFSVDPKTPHSKSLAGLVAPSNIRYRLRGGTEYADTNAIDVGFYDLAGVRTVMVAKRFSIQRVNIFPSNLIRIQYGQASYATMAEAVQAISTEVFITEQNIAENGLLRGLIIVRGDATILNDSSEAKFLEINRFGDIQSAASGGGTTTLQQAYNNSITPEILTDATNGALSVKRGSGADIDTVLEGLNGAGTTTFSVTGAGVITGSNFSGSSSGTNTGDQNLFSTLAVSGQSNVVADSTTDTLTLVAGTNITITTDAATDSVTINSTGGGSQCEPLQDYQGMAIIGVLGTYVFDSSKTGTKYTLTADSIPVGSNLIVELRKNSYTTGNVLSSVLQIATTDTLTNGKKTVSITDSDAFVAGDYVVAYLTSVGSTTPALNPYFTLTVS